MRRNIVCLVIVLAFVLLALAQPNAHSAHATRRECMPGVQC